MSLYFIKTPKFIQSFYKDYVWHINTDKKEVFLTFDDGPTERVTDFVLTTLAQYQVKATFFCIGKNINRHPTIFKRLIAEGHSVGNHTQNHENGWKTKADDYLESVYTWELEGNSFEKTKGNSKNKFFRPPYGKIKKYQAKKIILQGYKIIMWTILSGDFDTSISKEKCLQNVINNTQKGDILVFHDSEKAFEKLKYTLPKTLEYFTGQGYTFKAL